jgi:hypothetical protein
METFFICSSTWWPSSLWLSLSRNRLDHSRFSVCVFFLTSLPCSPSLFWDLATHFSIVFVLFRFDRHVQSAWWSFLLYYVLFLLSFHFGNVFAPPTPFFLFFTFFFVHCCCCC